MNYTIHLLANENLSNYRSYGYFNGTLSAFSYKYRNPARSEYSDIYHGSFHIQQSFDSYGSDRIYSKSSEGLGFVSSDKRIGGVQRSYDHGSGSYRSSEIIGRGTVYKNQSLIYSPTNQMAGSTSPRYAGKYAEGMITKDSEFNSLLSLKIGQADRIEKEAIMERSSLSFTGDIEGTASTKAASGSRLLMEQTFAGSFRIGSTFSIHRAPTYLYPHLNLTKTAQKQDAETVLFLINVTNDGNKTLGPVYIVDILPSGMIFINSSLIPSVSGQNISWTLLALPIGDVQSISLRAKLRDTASAYENRAMAIGRYGDEIVTAKASVIIVLEWLPCCVGKIITVKKQNPVNATLSFDAGSWKVPGCFEINGTLPDCDQYIDEYYSTSTSTCDDCLFYDVLPEIVYQDYLISND